MPAKNSKRIALYNKEHITDTAKGLFFQKGIKETSVEEIAKLGEISRVTIYKYFPTKLDIAVAVFCRYVRCESPYVQQNLLSEKYQTLSGYEQIHLQLLMFPEMQLENPAVLPFFSELNVLLCEDEAVKNAKKASSLNYNRFNEFYANSMQKGLQDGSICKRSDFEENDYLLVRKIIEGMILKCYLCFGREHFFIHQQEVHDKFAFVANKICAAFFKPQPAPRSVT